MNDEKKTLDAESEESLEHAISRWRDQLHGLDAEQSDELEDHLRKSLRGLPDQGLTADERVLIASRRIGPARTLTQQFEENLAAPQRWWRRSLRWTTMSVLPLLLGVMLVGLIVEAHHSNGDGVWGVFGEVLLEPVLPPLVELLGLPNDSDAGVWRTVSAYNPFGDGDEDLMKLFIVPPLLLATLPWAWWTWRRWRQQRPHA